MVSYKQFHHPIVSATKLRRLPHGTPTRSTQLSARVFSIVEASEVMTGEITRIPAEGALLPETYLVSRGDDRQALIDRMEAAQDALLDELWSNRAENLPFDTPEEAIILASVVEKETGIAHERPMVASVFVNRLRRGMRLQSDPTIIYGMTKDKEEALDGTLTPLTVS